MSYRKVQFANGEVYHIILKAVNNNLMFKNVDDYFRGIFSIYEFNNSKSVSIKDRRIIIKGFKNKKIRGKASGQESSSQIIMNDSRDKLVEVLGFCFMPNHVHLLVRQMQDNGITKYMSKIGTGYAGYFNRKHDRKGHLFQDKFYSVHVSNDNQLKIIFTYIHTNPLSLFNSNWKEIRVENSEKHLKFLNDYKWSSYQDYIGKKNFPSVTNRDFILELMNYEEGCKYFTKYWIEYKGWEEPEKCRNLFLE